MSTAIEPQVMPPTELELTVPKDISALAVGTQHYIQLATEFVVDSEPAFQVADEMQVRLRAEAKVIEGKRLDFTRPIDAIKKQWVEFFRPAVDARNDAALIYQAKMSAFRRAERQKAEAAQREAEALLRAEREKREAEARKLDEKAATLKTAAAQERAKHQAEEIRQVASMMPESVALAASEPQTVSSSVAELWRAEIVSVPEFLQWLITRPEWLTVLSFKDGEMNRLAKQCQNVVKVPGVKFHQRDSFRSKPR